MDKLSEEELQEFRDIFTLADREANGHINKAQLGELLETLGIDATAEELDLMLKEIDEDGSGLIEFDEFVSIMSRKVNASYSADQVKRAFKTFEGVSPDGYVRADFLVKALCTYGKDKMTEEQAAELVSQMESDPSGLINYKHYVDIMMT
jgi:calmodulin